MLHYALLLAPTTTILMNCSDWSRVRPQLSLCSTSISTFSIHSCKGAAAESNCFHSSIPNCKNSRCSSIYTHAYTQIRKGIYTFTLLYKVHVHVVWGQNIKIERCMLVFKGKIIEQSLNRLLANIYMYTDCIDDNSYLYSRSQYAELLL